MAWIESHQDIREHPKTYALMDCLKISKRDAIGLVHLLWWWALDHAMTGEIRQPNGAVARAVEWDGDATELVQALIKTGWMERTGGALMIHDWIHRAGAIVEKRLARKVLREKKADAKRRPNGRRTGAERLPNGAENCPTVSVSVSVSESLPKETPIVPHSGDVIQTSESKPLTPIQLIVRAWKIQTGVEPDDEAWDKAHFKRHCRPAQSLLNLFGADVDAAVDCIEDVYQRLVTDKNLDLSLQGVVNNSGRFRQEWSERKEKRRSA